MTHLRSLSFAICVAAGVAAAPDQRGARLTTYRETVPGTLATFEMVPIPGKGGVTPFYLGRTEVTWDMYDVFALGLDEKSAPGAAGAIARPSKPYGAPDYGWGHTGYPAISLAREAAESFAAWLAKKTGKPYRLPTEAEWELAASLAGRATDANAWHSGNSIRRTHPVGTRRPDALGLFDLYGNAAEWVMTADGARVVRGGSYRDSLDMLGPRAREVQDGSWNERDPQLPRSKWWLSDGPFVGFRLARSIQ